MALLVKTLGAFAALVAIVITLLGSILTLGGFLLAAIKILILVVFLSVVTLVIVSILRDRSQRRRAPEDF